MRVLRADSPSDASDERPALLVNGTSVLVRPLAVEDLAIYRDFLNQVTASDLRLRFFASMSEVSEEVIAALIHYNPAHAMAWIVIDEKLQKILGVGRLHDDKNGESAEFAILVGSQFKAHGVGWLLMERIVDHAKRKGIKNVHGQVLSENSLMLKMCAEFGFCASATSDDSSIKSVELNVQG
jgi:acetyltransferase